MASSEWRIVLEGSASALPKNFFGALIDAPSSYGILGSPVGSPSQPPNEFGAQRNLSNPMSLVLCPLSLTG
jgi:hypothetical protein